MRELIRIERGELNGGLRNYHLTIFEGDILYIQSLSQNSLRCVRDVLSGTRSLESGRLLIGEEKVSVYDSAAAARLGVYAVSFGWEFVETMSIAENLKPLRPFWHLYSVSRNVKEIRAYFEKEQVHLDPEEPVWKLSEGERKKLGLLKASLRNARLVILDLTSERLEGRTAEEICQMVKSRNAADQTAFLILSIGYTPIAEAATRVQVLHRGRDLKEWWEVSPKVRERLRSGVLFSPDRRKSGDAKERLFTGLYDYEWECADDIWEYLRRVKRNEPQVWKEHLNLEIPESGDGRKGGSVVIPAHSEEKLLPNLTVEENLTIAMGSRIAHGKYGCIYPRLQRNLVENFCRENGFEKTKERISDLSRVQRKILSVSRFALAKPQAILLDSPYGDLNAREEEQFREYLLGLARRGIKIFYFSRSRESMELDCRIIICTKNGESAKIDTYSHFFPPSGNGTGCYNEPINKDQEEEPR